MARIKLSPEFLTELENWELVIRRRVKSRGGGERPSHHRGNAVEFSDFKNYTPGDDFRRIDWNSYARLGRLFLKLYEEEQEAHLLVVLDQSSSLDFGEGRENKAQTVKELAVMFAYLALVGFDRVSVIGAHQGQSSYLPPVRGNAGFFRILDFVNGLPVSGTCSLAAALQDTVVTRPNFTIILSDFLFPFSEVRTAANHLQAQGSDLALVQVLSPFELNPELVGDLSLVDSESDERVDLTITPRLLADYRARLLAHCGQLRDFCHKRGAVFVSIPSSLTIKEFTVEAERAGLLA